MDWLLLLLLLIVGLIIIGFIYFDAKRRQNVRREKKDREWYEKSLDDKKDQDGFDLDGVGSVRLVGSEQEDAAEILTETKADVESGSQSTEIEDYHQEPIIDENTIQDVPVLDDPLFSFDSENFEAPKNEPRVSQPEQASLFSEEESSAVDAKPELIFSLYLVSNPEQPFTGPELVQSLLEQGMRHGDMDIFHRHSQSTGRGPIQFSLANAYDPGTFDMNKVDQLSTKGLAMFMTLPGPKKPMRAYQMMVSTAKAIVEQLGGVIIDSSKANFSKQIEAHHTAQIQEFERQQLLKDA